LKGFARLTIGAHPAPIRMNENDGTDAIATA
jgi:hypothetical protein